MERIESREDRRPKQVQKYMNCVILEGRKIFRVWHILAYLQGVFRAMMI